MKVIKVLMFTIVIIFIISCKKDYHEIKGQIAIEPINESKVIIYSGNSEKIIPFKTYFDTISFGGIRWLNTKDSFLISETTYEYYKGKLKRYIKTDISLIDLEGTIIKKVYKSEEGETASNYYPSINDNRLLFITDSAGIGSNTIDNLNPMVDINIMNLNTQEIIKKIEKFCPLLSIWFHESPWSPDENKIVYTLRTDRKIIVKGIKENVLIGEPLIQMPGVYKYDLNTNEHDLVVKNGSKASWSPKEEIISYELDNNIWLYNCAKDSSYIFYKSSKREIIKDYRWTPDGKYIFIICPQLLSKELSNFSTIGCPTKYNEKLIRVSDRMEVKFKPLNIGYSNFTWKK